MSLDASLKAANKLVRHRNVLTRAERIARLQDQERWDPAQGVFGLPKVAHRKASVGGKSKKKEQETEEAAPAAAAAPAEKPAKGAKK